MSFFIFLSSILFFGLRKGAFLALVKTRETRLFNTEIIAPGPAFVNLVQKFEGTKPRKLYFLCKIYRTQLCKFTKISLRTSYVP